MNISDWAAKHGVSPEALADLSAMLMPTTTETDAVSEAGVQALIRLEASGLGVRLWRNNVGAFKAEHGGFVRFGLANESKRMNQLLKSSDLIGIRPVTVTEAHVGRVLGVFVAREVKKPGWVYRGTEREKAQLNYLQLVYSLGGDAAFVAGPGSFNM